MNVTTFYQKYIRQRYGETLTDMVDELAKDPEALEIFAANYPDIWDDLAERGYYCLELEQFPQAQKVFEFIAENSSPDGEHLSGLGEALAATKRYMEAAEQFLRARELDPNLSIATFFLAEIWLFFRHYREGREELERFLAQSEGEPQLEWARQQAEKYLSYLREFHSGEDGAASEIT